MRGKELTFAVLGWGYWGPKVARNLDGVPHTGVRLVADTDERRLEGLKSKRANEMQTTSQIEDVWESRVDGVVIATPVRTHYSLAKAALQAGKHVLVEKPLTASVAEAEELVALAERVGKVLMVGHTFEYSPAVNELRKLVQSGELGRLYYIETERLNLGLFRQDINVIWDLAPHDLSILRYVVGEVPREVQVQAQAHVQEGIEDRAHLDLSYATGWSAHIHVSWLHPSKVRRVTVIGEHRMAVYDDTNPSEMVKVYNKGADVHVDPVVSYRYGAITIPHIDWEEPLRLECEDFVRAIQTGEPPRADGKAGIEVVRILMAAQDALNKQNAVPAMA